MSIFGLVTRDLVIRELSHHSSKYIPGNEYAAWNYWRVKKCISSIISNSDGKELDYPQDDAIHRMIYLSHFEKITGQIAYNTDVEVNKQGEMTWISVTSGRELHDLTGWDPQDFLLSHLYFLVDESLNITEKKNRDPIGGKQLLYLDCLISETIVTVNALGILMKYRALEEEDDETQLHKFVKELLSEIARVFRSEDFVEDIVMPCGTSKHTVYMSFIYSRDDETVKIRIDNLGLWSELHHKVRRRTKTRQTIGIYPRTLAKIPIDNLINHGPLHRYLEAVIGLTYRESEDPEDSNILYNENPKSTLSECQLIRKDSSDTYKAQPPQQTGHCVVINFYAAALNRVKTFKLSKYESAYNKIRNSEMGFIVKFERPRLSEEQKRQVERRAEARLRIGPSLAVSRVERSKSSAPINNTNIKGQVPDFKRKRLDQLVTHLGKLNKLRSDDYPVTMCAIHGITGSGKSSLVKQYIYEVHRKDPKAFCWYVEGVCDEDRTSISYRDHSILLLSNFGIYPSDYSHIGNQDLEFQKMKSDLWDIIGSYQKWVVVFDDAEKFEDIEDYLPQIPYTRDQTCQILVTTMNPSFFDDYANRPRGCFDINSGLDPKQALELFLKLYDRNEDDHDFKSFLKKLGHIPQDIHLAAVYLHNHPRCTSDAYLQMYSERDSRIWRPRVNTRNVSLNAHIGSEAREQTRDDRIKLSMGKLAVNNPAIYKLILYCSFLSNEEFPSEMIDGLLNKFRLQEGSRCPRFRSTNVDEDLERPLNKYDTYSLLNYNIDTSCYYMHYSTQKLILKMSLPRPKILICISDIIRGLYHFQEHSIESNRKIRGLFPHIRSIADQTDKLQLTEETCFLLLLLGQVSLSIGRYRHGLKRLQNANEIMFKNRRRCCRMSLKSCRTSKDLHIQILKEIAKAQNLLDCYTDASTTFDEVLKMAESFYGLKDFRYAEIFLHHVGNMTKLKNVQPDKVLEQAQKAIDISSSVEPESRSKDITLAQSYRIYAQSLWWLAMKTPMSEADFIQNRLKCHNIQLESYKLYHKHLGEGHLWIKRLNMSMAVDYVSKDMESFIDLGFGPISNKCITDAEARVKAEIENYGSRTPDTAIAYQWLSHFKYIEAGTKIGDRQDQLFEALTSRQEATKIWKLHNKELHEMYSHYWTGRILQRISDGCLTDMTRKHYRDLAIKEYDQTIAIGGPNIENQIDYYKDYVNNANKWRLHLIQIDETDDASLVV